MSKKKFKQGLESVFAPDPVHEQEGRGTDFLTNPFDPEKSKDQARPAKPRRSSSRKDFTTDLDSLLQEALQETFEEQVEVRKKQKKAGSKPEIKAFHKQTTKKRPLTGLDRLIRRTIESSDMDIAEEKPNSGKKRLVVTFEKEKVDKLKKIARMEKAYLKEILGDLVANFIKEYESKKGSID
ncbi:MAG: hypothetical protein CMN32_06925 [Saprospirales bacterium]|nr:hypothetical protein [Saprospirales bacterium]